MKEIQIPRRNLARSSDSGSKKLKDPELKDRKFAEKRQSSTFSDFSLDSTKDPTDSTPISGISVVISDSEAESIMQGSSVDLLSTPEICLLTDESSPVSTITNKDFHIDVSSTDRIASNAELKSMVVEINELKKLISSVESSEESYWIDGVVSVKFRIVLLSFLLWAILAAIVVFFRSGEVAYYGPLPT